VSQKYLHLPVDLLFSVDVVSWSWIARGSVGLRCLEKCAEPGKVLLRMWDHKFAGPFPAPASHTVGVYLV